MNEVAQPFTTIDPSANEPRASALAASMGHLLLQTGKVSKAQLNAIFNLQAEEGLHFGDAAARLGLADDEDVKAVLVGHSYVSIDTRNTRLARCLTAAFRPQSPAAEALRSLRSELLLRYFGTGNGRGLALIGSDDARGIAYTAANLAISFAQIGARTLLVDANLRKPHLDSWFGLSGGEPGLTDLLGGRRHVQPCPVDEIGPLWLLPAGTRTPHPQELLSGRHYKEFLPPLYEAYDVVLISTPPMSGNRDAQIIAAQTGAALLITREHRTRIKDLEALCGNLKGLGVRLLGAALHQ